MRRAARTALGAVLALTLAACAGGHQDSTSATAPAPASAPPSAPASASPTPTPSPSATPSPGTPSPATPSASAESRPAKDGRRLSSCADASCEVEVEAGDVLRLGTSALRKAGFADLKVQRVREDKVIYELASGAWTFTQPGPTGSANLNGISLTLVRVDGGRAVIRLGGKPIKGAVTLRLGPDGMTMVTG
ncbi:hypothetical protein GCM10022224_003720 [Nonomuraea antimicrobica]|uniref:Uncharacterized protein n=1 Tax=Nonomuraea antimicrobica TaxID=561173 RepID=A0ABP7AZM9_9ACTN